MAGERILLVEDERFFAKELQSKLERMGYTVTGNALSGEDALQQAEECCPDLVLMDIHLSGPMDGIETATQISTHFNIPVIHLMAYTDTETIQSAKISPAFGYILKPLRERELETNIEIVLYKHKVEMHLKETNRHLEKEIIEHKRTEKELEKYQKHLEDLVEERTAELVEANAQLRQKINEHKQTERTLRIRNYTIASSISAIAMSDLDGNLIYVNPAFLRIWGYNDDTEVLGRSAYEFWQRPEGANEVIQALGEQGEWFGELIGKRNDGSSFNTEVAAYMILDQASKPVGMAASFLDITERKRAEEALRQARKEWEEIFQAIGHPTLILDKEHRILAANRATLKATGLTEEELTTKKCFEIFHHSSQHPEACPLQKLLHSGCLETVEMEMEALDGVFLVSCTPVVDENGELQKIIHIATDITGRKQAEEELEKHREHLEELVQARTNELQEANRQLAKEIEERKRAEEELQKAKEIAEAANRAKSEFLANMSHELRTPLNAILGYAQILSRDEGLTDRHREQVGIIHRSGDHLLAMITEILDLAKIEARRVELEPANFYLPGLLKNIVDMVQIRAYRKRLSFTSEIASDIPEVVYGDEKRLRQILINLLSNAVKFTEEGKVSLRVYEFNELPAQKLKNSKTQKLRFEVEDTGIGIPPEQIDKIFLPFEQVSEKLLDSEGTGLGLAITQKLVRMMGSELRVTSTIGKGSTFWFDLDLPEIEGEAKPVTPETRRIMGFKGPSTGSGRAACKILIADDNEGSRAVLKEMLSSLNFEVSEAVDGHDVLKKAKTCHPDVILMDLMMPEMDGFEATRRIRELEHRTSNADTGDQHPASNIQHPASSDQHPVIIAVSANVFKQTQEKSVAAGCDDFIAKPISKQVLLHKLQIHLKGEWIYEDEKDGPHFQSGVHPAEEGDVSDGRHLESGVHLPIIPPPPEEVSLLNEMALIGDIMGIRERIEEIDKLDPKFTPFAAKMRKLAKELNLLEIQDFLNQYIES